MMMKSFWPLKFFAAARMMNPLRGGMNAFRLVGQRAGEALRRQLHLYPFPKWCLRARIVGLEGPIGEKSCAWNVMKWLSAKLSLALLFPDDDSTHERKTRLNICGVL